MPSYVYNYICICIRTCIHICIYCFRISRIRLHMHTYIHSYIHIYNSGAWTPNRSFMQSFFLTHFAGIVLQAALCTHRHSHSNKHSHTLRLKMKIETGTLDTISYDTHKIPKCKYGLGVNPTYVHVHMSICIPTNPMSHPGQNTSVMLFGVG